MIVITAGMTSGTSSVTLVAVKGGVRYELWSNSCVWRNLVVYQG
jgi:hypothetical protein